MPFENYIPGYPRNSDRDADFNPLSVSHLPTSTTYVPQPDYKSSAYVAQYHEVQTCYLDREKRFPAPDLYAYNGVVQGQPEPVVGSHNLLGLREDVCFDRFGRYGPYGLGYPEANGGMDVGMNTEQEGSEDVWAKTGKIDYSRVDWGDAQDRCYEANRKRFTDGSRETYSSTETGSDWPQASLWHSEHGHKKKIPRTAIVVRLYVGFPWTQHAVLNFRAMLSELSLRSGGEYAVHFLVHVRDDDLPVWADPETAQQVLDENVPVEFHGLCTLWSEAQMRLLYPGEFGPSIENPSFGDIHGVYRSAHFPLQHFAQEHRQYAHFWNWELDMRWVGNYYELFDRLGVWARKQSRVGMWERASKYYIPRYHGDWDNFTALVKLETEESGREAVLGPVHFAGRKPTRAEERGESFMPDTCSQMGRDGPWVASPLCGVGEDADLITLNPMFDTEGSGWVFDQDVTGYDRTQRTPPRRSAIVTASRLSRRLLDVMHEETWRLHHAMFSEMFPATMALHHGLKAVYAPHPVFFDRAWDLEAVDRAFNGGRDHTTGGPGSPFDVENEHNHRGTTWYYNSEFAGRLWRRWLGYAQETDVTEMGDTEEETEMRGGKEDEESAERGGRMCLRSMLVHPIKWEDPEDLEW